MSWYIEGAVPERDKFIKDAYRPTIYNFWLKEGETREIVFLDDARFGVYEHKIPYQGKFKTFTCSGTDCILCGTEKNRGYSEYYSILDLTPYLDKDKKEKKYSRKALAVTKAVAEILEKRRVDAGGSLAGTKFRVSRTGTKSPSTGNDWVFLQKVDLAKVPNDVKVYEFREMLRPRPSAEIEAILKFSGGGEAKTISRSSLTDNMDQTNHMAETDDIPF